MTIRSRGVMVAVVAAWLVMLAADVHAQTYPSKPVRLIVPFVAGGPTDVIARLVGQKLGEMWGQPVVVDNRGGAGGNIGADLTAKAAPDGYTLILMANSHVINASIFPKLPYDALRDFTPVTMVAWYHLVLVVNPSLPVKSVPELVALARSKPGQLAFGSAGVGTPTHLTAELFKLAAGIDMIHVPYKGSAPATTDLISGQVSLMFNNPLNSLPYVKSGRLRALATTGRKRSPTTPDLPTIAELGYPNFESSTWFGVQGPAKLPASVVSKLHTDIVKVLQMADVRDKLAEQGLETIGNTPEEFAAVLRADFDRWAKVVKAANVRAD